MMKFHDFIDRAEAEKIANKVGFRTYGTILRRWVVTADASEITTNGKLNMAKTKEVIAKGGRA